MPEIETELVAGLPRTKAAVTNRADVITNEPPRLVDLDTIAAMLHREGFCPWIRHDGEEWDVELQCSVEVLPNHVRRPNGRGVKLADAVGVALAEKVRIVRENPKARGAK